MKVGLFEQVVVALVDAGGDKITINDLSSDHAVLAWRRSALAGATQVIVVRADAALTEQTLKARIAAAVGAPVELVVVGGDASIKGPLGKARPRVTAQPVGLLHIADDYGKWASRSMVDKKLLELAALPALDQLPERWRQLENGSVGSRARHAEQRQQLADFAQLFKQRSCAVTYALAGLILAVFGLEIVFGGAKSTLVLMRMGALMPSRVSHGEWWRLLAGTFLHAGWLHVGFNVYVLVILGRFVERIIGSARFLLLYAASALAGAIGSYVFLGGRFSVGASGAVWGLLGAHAVLAYRPRGLLPDALLPAARRAAMINLAINVLNSFRPHVDMFAHFAGGAAGAALLATGLLTRGLHAPTADDPAPTVHTPKAMWGAAAVAAALLVAGPVIGIIAGNPLELRAPQSRQRVRVASLGVSLEVPQRLAAQVERAIGAAKNGEIALGDPLVEPLSVGLKTFRRPAEAFVEPQITEALKQLEKTLPTPKTTKPLALPRRFKTAGAKGLSVSYRYPNGLVIERAFLFKSPLIIRVDALRWPAFPRSAPAGSAQTIASSAKVL